MGLAAPPNTENAPPLVLPMLFMVTGLAGFLGGLADLLVSGRDLLQFLFGAPAVLAAVHFFTLGFISMVMMGAMYQLVPVVMNTTVASVSLGYWHYAFYLVGVVLLITGLGVFAPVAMIVGGSSILIGAVLFLVNMARTMARARAWSLSGVFLVASLTYLAATVSFGWLLAWNFFHPWLGTGAHTPMLLTHLSLGLAGWFSLTLMGVSYKLLPMFILSPGRAPAGRWVFGLLNAALLAVVAGTWVAPRTSLGVAGLLGLMGSIAYLVDVGVMVAERRRRQLDPAVRTALAGPVALALWWLLLAWALLVPSPGRWAAVFFLLFNGWLGLSLTGYLQKIVPFLVWLHRYGRGIGQGRLPRIKDLLPERWSWQVAGLYGPGLVAAVAALLAGSGPLLAVGLGLEILGVIRLLVAVLAALWGKPRLEAVRPAVPAAWGKVKP
ncbi:conserved membrane protein of unknown function [Candidatus Hydrogenisulfobacillus filiaventi]|uniref:Uncharacterized protein n=1 Tax=Candidatus Hydrogenisulfobacillus filiaventi TaxID=2707344 RepID=A0A6F8ZE25_9FIRM|nr:conserved membrane protein of unknown function [Candidatus Hydrogenisulfobacillus filiaventi]